MNSKELTHHRSPVFTIQEVELLLSLVEKYKSIILNRSTVSTSLQVKEATWGRLAKIFNSANLGYERPAETLQMKWANLKRNARRVSLNVTEDAEMDIISKKVSALVNEAENNTEPLDASVILSEESENGDVENHLGDSSMMSDSQSDTSETEKERRHRDANFSPNECCLLFKCVKEELNVLMCKDIKKEANQQKKMAWSRVTENFNKLSPTKRSEQVLKNKLNNMKKIVKRIGLKNYINRYAKVENAIDQIKNTPIARDIDEEVHIKAEPLDVGHIGSADYCLDREETEILRKSPPPHDSYEDLDPLNMVINGDSGSGFTDVWHDGDTKDIVKMKLDLLKYEMETAKLKRQRIEEALKADMADREQRSLEAALRLRAARLEVVAAEAKLPQSHPALKYTERETTAREYIQKLDNT
ncbi:uncharacterized protein LOC126972467 [Leptidea sinapis]|uniref:uncharacterized protein LOC126972467 n=1 Tax=Leptidea sinapis TaxID=189913 RepID=UPI00213B7F5D|nr:uncharacterized protein LOC126972467 [Leptidea sinapis]